MLHVCMKQFPESVYPYQVYIMGGTAQHRGNLMEIIDDWCYSQWGNEPDESSDWNLMRNGWGFKQESDAVLLCITWSS